MGAQFAKLKSMIHGLKQPKGFMDPDGNGAPPASGMGGPEGMPSMAPSALEKEGAIKGPNDDQKHQEKLMKKLAAGKAPR